jgi:hypothetical protein
LNVTIQGYSVNMADKGMYPGQRSMRVHAVVMADDGIARSRCEDRPLEVKPGIFNPMADTACRECCMAIRLVGDPRQTTQERASR